MEYGEKNKKNILLASKAEATIKHQTLSNCFKC